MKVAGALRAEGLTIVCHDERFRQGTPDEEWLVDVGASGWVLLTKDARIRSSAVQKQILLNAGVRAFILTSANLTGPQMAAIFRGAARRMCRIALSERRPFIATISPSGAVKLVLRGPKRP